MQIKKQFSSGTQWEDFVGYSRAIRNGHRVEVSGTVSVDENGRVVGKNDAYEQTHYVLTKIKAALEQVGAKLEDVVRTRMYVTDINNWQAIGKAHGEFFRDIKPSSTMVEISRLIGLDFLIEIEVSAIVDE